MEQSQSHMVTKKQQAKAKLIAKMAQPYNQPMANFMPMPSA